MPGKLPWFKERMMNMSDGILTNRDRRQICGGACGEIFDLFGNRWGRYISRGLISSMVLGMYLGTGWAQQIAVPNGSFELPATPFADPRMDAWQKSPQPVWYTDGDEFPWEQLMGQFRNPPPGEPGHTANMDGEQAAFMFAYPEVAIFQDALATTSTGEVPESGVNTRFEAGKVYRLTVALRSGGGGMKDGASFEIGFYYRNAEGQRIPVNSSTLTHVAGTGVSPLLDFHASTDTVQVDDPWEGKPIGIRLASIVGFENAGGYWDLDNVRLRIEAGLVLQVVPEPAGGMKLSLTGGIGSHEVLASPDPTLPLDEWTVLGTVEGDGSGEGLLDQEAGFTQRFYIGRKVL
jgi:hypothetical protein